MRRMLRERLRVPRRGPLLLPLPQRLLRPRLQGALPGDGGLRLRLLLQRQRGVQAQVRGRPAREGRQPGRRLGAERVPGGQRR